MNEKSSQSLSACEDEEIFLIRNAAPSDLDGLASLLEQLFSIEADFIVDNQKQQRGLRLMLDGCGKHRSVMVAVHGDTVIGMISVQTLISTAEGALAAVVEDLVVDAGWRQKGAGERLLAAVLEWTGKRGISRLQLLADKNNDSALQFYRKQGWDETDLICLRKRISTD